MDGADFLVFDTIAFFSKHRSFGGLRHCPVVSFPGGSQIETINLFVRKLGHWSEYFLLAILVLRALDRNAADRSALRSSVVTVVWVFLYAVTDEFHQYFVPSRMASFADVLLDSFGGHPPVFFLTPVSEQETENNAMTQPESDFAVTRQKNLDKPGTNREDVEKSIWGTLPVDDTNQTKLFSPCETAALLSPTGSAVFTDGMRS